jgi:uncharacterized membrane protein
MERMAEGAASGMGTVAFVLIGAAIILGWVSMNGAAPSATSPTASNSTPSRGSS